MNSIYTEYANLTPEHIEWLDGCGAKWVIGGLFTSYIPNGSDSVMFNQYENHFTTWNSDLGSGSIDSTHIPTGSEFCEKVAEILGIDKPTFASNLKDKLVKKLELHDRMERPLPEVNIPKTETPTYPHKTYLVLDSLDGIPLDTRIPLSEWIPPIEERVCFIWAELFYVGCFVEINSEGFWIQQDNGKGRNANLDGHWMRIV